VVKFVKCFFLFNFTENLYVVCIRYTLEGTEGGRKENGIMDFTADHSSSMRARGQVLFTVFLCLELKSIHKYHARLDGLWTSPPTKALQRERGVKYCSLSFCMFS
jgi:hypothetical protein